MSTSIWISTIAVVISALSFLLHFKKYWRERPKLTILPNKKGTYFFPVTDSDKLKDHYQSPFRILIHVTLVNESEKPITIIRFNLYASIYIGDSSPLGSDQFIGPNKYYTVYSSDKGSRRIHIEDKLLKPVFVIEPYGAVQGFVFFPNCPIVHADDFWGNLVVETSRGEFNELVTLYKPLQTD